MNQIADKRYRELVRLLVPAGPGSMQNVSPWSLEKNRTFSCPCGHKVVIPESALKLTEVSDEEGNSHDIVHVNLGKNLNCPGCKKPHYELMSFANRYGLLRATPQPRKKKQKDPELKFTEFIECKPKGE